MKYFDCGQLKMPAVGLGTLAASDQELEDALDLALQIGYRYFDTAFAYGNEKVVGRVLNRWISSGKLKREDIFLTTKCPPAGIHPDKVESYMKNSLENLQLDYVDLYILHYPVGILVENGKTTLYGKTDFAAIWKKMEDQVKAGRTKTIGVSNYNIQQLQTILNIAEIPPVNNQVELHVFLQQPELVKFCHDNNISVVAYRTLVNPAYLVAAKRFGFEAKQIPDAFGNSTVKSIAKKHGKNEAQILLRYVVELGVAVIPKSTNPERLRQNFDLFGFELDADDLAALKKLDLGPKGRISDWLQYFTPELANHPDYPWKQ